MSAFELQCLKWFCSAAEMEIVHMRKDGKRHIKGRNMSFLVESMNVSEVEVNPIMWPFGGRIIKSIYHDFHCIAS